ncbi:MAG: peptidase M14 [Candidatus Aminicenantes bacterium]|nr:peptidase M14 [Candidatus Aminicenantes bacterium]
MKQKRLHFLILIFSFQAAFSLQAAEKIPSCEEILGFKVGQDFKLASWSQITDYFNKLAQSSPKAKVLDLGESTLGRRFIMAVITSPANMDRLDEIREIQKKLHDPRSIQPGEKEELIRKGKAVVLIACSIHSREIASSLMSLELAYKLATEESPGINKILEETILLLIPSVNPDGIDLVYDWYTKHIGTPFEASRMPWLYHHYVGHDNNRDWFMITQKETQLVTKVLYKEWFPLLLYDVHQMGSYGPRFFIPPYHDPINPNLDPLLLRELNLLGANAALSLTKEGKTGVATSAIFDAWYTAANRAAPLRHNVMGILSEAASANLASPIFIRKDQIRLSRRGFQGTGVQANYLEPWPGGWWRIRDIIDYEYITALSFLKMIAQEKKKYLSNFSLYAQRQIQKGKTEPPFAFLIPLAQKDLPTAHKLLQVLQKGGAEIYQAQSSFVADEVTYPANTYIIPLAQPYRAFIKDLLETKSYPKRISLGGTPELPYDESSWTLPLQMGVQVIQVTNSFSTGMKRLEQIGMSLTEIKGKGSRYFVFPNQGNNGTALINRLLKKKVKIYYAKMPFQLEAKLFPPGTIILPGSSINRSQLSSLAKNLGLVILATDKKPAAEFFPLLPPKIGIYQSWVPSKDEGWLRWTMEQFEFPFKLIHNEEIRAGNLRNSYSHIILPSMRSETLMEGRKEGETLPQYKGGIGIEGVSALDIFIQEGGNLIVIGNSCDFAAKYLGLGVKNLVDIQSVRRRYYDSPTKQEQKEIIFCPGSLLKVKIDDSHPVAFGMGKQGSVFSYFSPVFSVEEGTAVVSYPPYNPLLSGILLNEGKILSKAAAVECSRGLGKVLLLGFKVVHRAQAHGTFKFLFNSLLY